MLYQSTEHGQIKAEQFLFLLRHFDEFDPKINVLYGSDKRKENELFVCNKHGLKTVRKLQVHVSVLLSLHILSRIKIKAALLL